MAFTGLADLRVNQESQIPITQQVNFKVFLPFLVPVRFHEFPASNVSLGSASGNTEILRRQY